MERHPLDSVSLVFGLVFVAAGALLLANRLDLVTQARWAVPVLLILVSLVTLASVWRSGRGRGEDL